MVYFDERSNTHSELGKALMLSIQELVQKACYSLNVFQGLLVEIDDENVNILVKSSAGQSPNFKSIPVFSADPSSENRFPINSDVCPMGFKHWFSMYFNADRYIRGKFHYVDSRQFCLIFINACPSQTINHEKIALVDEWLSVTVEKYLIEKAEARQKSLFKKTSTCREYWHVGSRYSVKLCELVVSGKGHSRSNKRLRSYIRVCF